MTDWAVLAAAITGAPSVAAVIICAIWTSHRRWAAREADQHQHVWSMWGEPEEQPIHAHGDIDRIIDYRDRYMRACATCGQVEYKSYSRVKERWL